MRSPQPGRIAAALSMLAVTACARPILWANDHADVAGSVGAGFAGVSTAVVTEYPSYDVRLRCPTCTDSVSTYIADSVDLVSNKTHRWKPAVSSGIVVHYFPNRRLRADSTAFSVGLGAHIAFVPTSTGTTSPVPAATLHIGNRANEFFLGFLFTSNDEVLFPGPASRSGGFRTRRDSPPDLGVTSSGHFYKNFYIGVQINGRRQGESNAQDAAGTSVASITVEPDTTIKVGSSLPLRIVLRDAQQSELKGRLVSISSSNSKIATVGDDWVLHTDGETGTVTITARSGNASGSTTIIVTK